MPYVERGLGAGKKAFMVYGKYDPTFLPELTAQMLAALRRHGAQPAHAGAPLRPLLAGAAAVQPHRRLPHADVPSLRLDVDCRALPIWAGRIVN